MKLSRYKQESILNYNAGEQTATLYTRDKAVMRKLDTYLKHIPFQNHMSATASREQSAQSRGNEQGR